MSSPAIRVGNLSKQYHIGLRENGYTTFREALSGLVTRPFERFRKLSGRAAEDETFWALKDVSFDVQPGEVVGIIGRNGAGKSTLLKILSRITEPTTGRVEINGRVASLLEVGTGFHPELTGRENIFLNGAILGMSRVEIKRKFDEIVDFSGVEKFLDTPVKRYSSGMSVRLAFAVAAHLEPEILIIDEVLAVGDAEFQRRCLGKMSGIAASGRTVVFVSHNMTAVENLCTHAIVLERGSLIAGGNDVLAMISDYHQRVLPVSYRDLRFAPRMDGYAAVITDVDFVNSAGAVTSSVRTGGELTIRIHYESPNLIPSPFFAVALERMDGERVFWINTDFQHGVVPDVHGSGIMECTIPALRLLPSDYAVTVAIGHGVKNLDYLPRARTLTVVEADVFRTGKLPPTIKCATYTECVWQGPTRC